jgi:hypothetical protein
MRWRVRAAVVVLAAGFVYALAALAVNTAAAPAQPREMPDLVKVEATLVLSRKQLGLPDRGVIAYRDDVSGHPFQESRANHYFFFAQYALAPLVLDPDHDHDLTLVFTPAGFRTERRPGAAP